MYNSFAKKMISGLIRCSNKNFRKNILKTAIYIANSVRESPGSYTYEIHQRMSVCNILPSIVDSTLDNELTFECISELSRKIKIRIVYPSGTAWNCIGTVYDELLRDDRYQVVIITEDYPAYIRVMKDKGCQFIRLENYDIKIDKPDILVLTSYSFTCSKLNFPSIRKYVKIIISLFPNIVINEFDMEQHWKFVYNAYEFCEPDYYLFDSLVFNNCGRYIDKKKAIHLGNPQFDELFYNLNEADSDYPMWDKLQGKKVFLWAMDHGLNEYYPIDAISLDLYIKDIFLYFKEHQDIGLIIRPHPYLIREMQQSRIFWNEIDFQKIIDFCKNSPNIVWDNSSDYCLAFKKCDAMMVDVNCSFIISFLVTGKPICRVLRNDIKVGLIHPELKECYYYCNNFDECKKFIESVIEGKDPLYDRRKKAFHNSIMHFDGRNGIRIKNFFDKIIEEKHVKN